MKIKHAIIKWIKNIWKRVLRMAYGLRSVYDVVAFDILPQEQRNERSVNVVQLAEKYGMEVLLSPSWPKGCAQLILPWHNQFLGKAERNALNPDMHYHLLLHDGSATEIREWVAYFTVLAALCEKREISARFLERWSSADTKSRNDTWHRIALCVLVPNDAFIEWEQANRGPDKAAMAQKMAVDFGISVLNAEERLSLIGNGKFIPGNFLKKDEHTDD